MTKYFFGESKFLVFPHFFTVQCGKKRNSLTENIFRQINYLTSNFFSKTIDFTKFLWNFCNFHSVHTIWRNFCENNSTSQSALRIILPFLDPSRFKLKNDSSRVDFWRLTSSLSDWLKTLAMHTVAKYPLLNQFIVKFFSKTLIWQKQL